MNPERSYVVETIAAVEGREDDVRRMLQDACDRIGQLAGVHQIELISNREDPLEFVVFLVADDFPAVSAAIDSAAWHQQLVVDLSPVVTAIKRTVGKRANGG